LQAVKLHFDEGDPLAVNLILVSAFRVGRDLVKRRRPHEEILQTVIKPEMLGTGNAEVGGSSKFRYAEKDSDDALEVPETLAELNEMLLFVAINFTSWRLTTGLGISWFTWLDYMSERRTQRS
jgi:hypothetical protein